MADLRLRGGLRVDEKESVCSDEINVSSMNFFFLVKYLLGVSRLA